MPHLKAGKVLNVQQTLNFTFMRTIDKIITKVDVSRGAPMGRFDVGSAIDIKETNDALITPDQGCKQIKRVYDCKVNLSEGYDKGGAYWGIGAELRVRYTKDLSFIHFYRVGDNF